MSRTERERPNELTSSWPDTPSEDPVGEDARRFVANLREAINGRSLRSIAAVTGVTHVSLIGILAGKTWPDLRTISRLERGLEVRLWPTRD